MRILYHHRTQAEDGQAVHIRSLQRAFEAEGHQVREVALVQRAPSSSGRAQKRAQKGGSPWRAVTRLPRFARELAEYVYTPVARPRIVAAARDARADFIYERYAFGNAAGVQAARRLGCPLVLEVNSPMVHELENTRGLSFPRLARRVETYVFRSADLVCVVTAVLADMLAAMGVERERLFVTPNGVHPELYRTRGEGARGEEARAAALRELGLEGEERVVLGFVGYYRSWHRIERVVAALARSELANAVLVLVGEGPARGEIAAAACAAGVEQRVVFAGPRRHDAIPGLLAAFDVALLPAINPYASPLKLFEYMAAGLPVVAPDQPNLREILVDGANALLVPPEGEGGAVGEDEALAGALERLARDRGLRDRLGAAARATVEERDLTWRGNARRVVAAVEALA